MAPAVRESLLLTHCAALVALEPPARLMLMRSLTRLRNFLAVFLASDPKAREKVLVTLDLKLHPRIPANRTRLSRLSKEEHGRICTNAFDANQMPAVVDRDLILSCRERAVSGYEAKRNVDFQVCCRR